MMVPFQAQVNKFWKKQTSTQRITLVVLLAAAAVLIPVLISWATTPSYSVAYSGLSDSDAGEIIAKLDELAIPYQLKGSGTILVPTDQVYEARIKMAVEGLPESSTVGYELFSESTLGMTEFTQQVNYQRALEGELERTIGSLDAIEAVSVHVVTPEKSLLTSTQSPATASVTIKERSGQSLGASQVTAIANLVASSVEGMQPENVVVVDTNGNLLAGGASADSQNVAVQSDSQRAAEVAAAADVRERVQSMLDSILGPDRAIVQASVAMDWTERQITSNTYDPTSQVVLSSQKINEVYSGDGTTTSGVPGAATNLPTAAPNAVATAVVGANAYTHSEETINYEVSQVEAVEVVAPGQIERVTISVMVDDITDAGQIQTIKNAVTAAAGIDETRGDQVVVESMAFDRTYYEEQTAELEETTKTNQYIQIGLAVLAALLVIGLIFYFSRMIANLRASSTEAWRPVMLPVGEMTMDPGKANSLPAQASGSSTNASLPAGTAGSQPAQPSPTAQRLSEDVMVEINSRHQPQTQVTPEETQRVKMINKLAEENPATVAEIIQIWLNEDNKKNG